MRSWRMWSALILASWICVLLASASLADPASEQKNPDNPAQSGNEDETHKIGGFVTHPSVITAIHEKYGQHYYRYPDDDCYDTESCGLIHSIEWLASFIRLPSANLLTAIATFILALLVFFQLKWNRQQAEATKEAARLARQSLEMSHRAHLSIQDVAFGFLGASATITIRKSGSMPATRINAKFLRKPIAGDLIVNENTFDLDLHPPLQGGIVPHNSPISWHEPRISTEAFEEWKDAEAGKTFIYMGFMIAYFDGFTKRQTWQVFRYTSQTHAFRIYRSKQD